MRCNRAAGADRRQVPVWALPAIDGGRQARSTRRTLSEILGWLPDGPRKEQMGRVVASADFLVDNLHRVPVHVIPCIEARVGAQPAGPYQNIFMASTYGSILPAA